MKLSATRYLFILIIVLSILNPVYCIWAAISDWMSRNFPGVSGTRFSTAVRALGNITSNETLQRRIAEENYHEKSQVIANDTTTNPTFHLITESQSTYDNGTSTQLPTFMRDTPSSVSIDEENNNNGFGQFLDTSQLPFDDNSSIRTSTVSTTSVIRDIEWPSHPDEIEDSTAVINATYEPETEYIAGSAVHNEAEEIDSLASSTVRYDTEEIEYNLLTQGNSTTSYPNTTYEPELNFTTYAAVLNDFIESNRASTSFPEVIEEHSDDYIIITDTNVTTMPQIPMVHDDQTIMPTWSIVSTPIVTERTSEETTVNTTPMVLESLSNIKLAGNGSTEPSSINDNDMVLPLDEIEIPDENSTTSIYENMKINSSIEDNETYSISPLINDSSYSVQNETLGIPTTESILLNNSREPVKMIEDPWFGYFDVIRTNDIKNCISLMVCETSAKPDHYQEYGRRVSDFFRSYTPREENRAGWWYKNAALIGLDSKSLATCKKHFPFCDIDTRHIFILMEVPTY